MWQTIKKWWHKISRFVVKWLKRLLYLVLAYAVLALVVFGYQLAVAALRSNPDADLIDNSDLAKGNRRSMSGEIIESARRMVNLYRTPTYQRDAHARAHGCVRATFEVFDTEAIYNHGIFENPGKYEAWIRFSSGSVPTLIDPKADARGMAIKVMGVPGQQLLPAKLAGQTQDFLMVNSKAFFVRSLEEYVKLEKAAADGKPFTYFFGDYYLNPFKWKFRSLYLGLSTKKKGPPTPLSTQYYSMTPYNLGPNQIKFSAKSCEVYTAPAVNDKDPNFLREAMRRVLREKDACFQFMVQLRDPDARMPIQDQTVVWSEKKSPFVQIARVHIPRQEFDTAAQNEMCENLSFNPWHAVEGQEPLGYMNELRRDLYLHTAAYRQTRNGVTVDEPNSWCDSLAEYCPDKGADADAMVQQSSAGEADPGPDPQPDPELEIEGSVDTL